MTNTVWFVPTASDDPAGAASTGDLARPKLPQPFRAINALGRPLSRAISVEAPSIVVGAIKKSGFSDVETEGISEPLEILCRSLDRDADLHPIGRFAARSQLISLVATRPRLSKLIADHPEILDGAVDDPIIVTGLPRSGTTLLQRLIAADDRFRSFPYWEALNPLPTSDPADRSAATDDRERLAEKSVDFVDRIAPGMRSIHELDPHAAEEEIWPLAVDLASMLFESSWHVPSFAEWYDGADLTEGYRTLRTIMAVASWYRPAERWVLKSPPAPGAAR